MNVQSFERRMWESKLFNIVFPLIFLLQRALFSRVLFIGLFLFQLEETKYRSTALI